jgi:hypothetical protein
VVRPCGQSACSEIALTRRDDLAVQQLHRSAGALHHHAHAALLCILAAAIGPAAARQRAALLLVVIPAGHLLLSLSIQAPKSGRRAVQHRRAAVIGREILASRPSRRNRCSAAVSSFALATHTSAASARDIFRPSEQTGSLPAVLSRTTLTGFHLSQQHPPSFRSSHALAP